MNAIPWELFWQLIVLSLLGTLELVLVVRSVRLPVHDSPTGATRPRAAQEETRDEAR